MTNQTGPRLWSINGRFLAQKTTGVQRYAREVTQAIDNAMARENSLSRGIRFEIIVPRNCGDVPDYQTISVRRSRQGAGHVWEQCILPQEVTHGLLSFANLGPVASKHQIICIHDANVFVEPSSYSFGFRNAYRTLLPVLAKRAERVTTVSKYSAKMLREFGITGFNESVVIANGHEHALTWDAGKSRYNDPAYFKRPYVFALGSQAKHKQLSLLLELLPRLDELGLDLVVAGGFSSIFAETGLANAPNLHRLGFVGDDDLAALFRHALCFAFPSRTEGFGIPLLEAMVHGCPIITSNLASMPEVCGQAALYPANSAMDWFDHIGRVAQDATLRRSLREAGSLRYKTFSWDDAAAAYIDTVLMMEGSLAHAA